MPRTPEPPDFPASQLFLRRLAYSLVRDSARAEDLVQETWAAWVEHEPRDVAEPRAWLARVLRNRAFNAKRSDARRAEREAFAGRPDPSTPETDGTLEAQAQLVAALQKLDEPFRSALVQRYYHDLSPKEIAERSGTPLDTIKSRLARGLEKLRSEMDRRYHGDRKAWCHWLTVLGQPAPFAVPTAHTPTGPLTGVGGSASSWLGWTAVVALLAAVGAWRAGWLRLPEVRGPVVEPRVGTEPARDPEVGRVGRVPAPSAESDTPSVTDFPVRRPRPSVVPPPPESEEAERVVAPFVREDFDWPQYLGSADHDTWRKREDEIRSPEVLWAIPYCAGQPTLRDGDLYTGGLSLARIDPASGKIIGFTRGLLAESLELDPDLLESLFPYEHGAIVCRLEALTTEHAAVLAQKAKVLIKGEGDDATFRIDIGPAPAITAKLVLARRVSDGSVLAFDRTLATEVWRWTPEEPTDATEQSRSLPGCLIDDEFFGFGLGSEVVVLRVEDGTVAWRFDVDAPIETVPAYSGHGPRALFVTSPSRLYAFDLKTGREMWERESPGCSAWSTPVVLDDRVIVTDVGQDPARKGPMSQKGHVHAFAASGGRQLWQAEFDDDYRLSSPATGDDVGGRLVWVGSGYKMRRVTADRGKVIEETYVGACATGTPAILGESFVFATSDSNEAFAASRPSEEGRFHARTTWSFRARSRAFVEAFVHTGKRIYLSTPYELVCIADSGGDEYSAMFIQAPDDVAFPFAMAGER